jgi:fido (protein-threonine AMPylation protein)
MNFEAAAKYWGTLEKELVLNPPLDVIQDLHRRLFADEPDYRAGQLKASANYVPLKGGQFQWFTLPHDVEQEFDLLNAQLAGLLREMEKAEEAEPMCGVYLAFAHARMIYIHPFVDGNGRLLRWVAHAQSGALAFEMGEFEQLFRNTLEGKHGAENWSYIEALQQAPNNLFHLVRFFQREDAPEPDFPLPPPHAIPSKRDSRPPM